jgi:hypothetical protein
MQFFLKALFISFIFLAFISCASKKSKNNRSKKGVYVTVDPGYEGFIYDKDKPADQIQIYTEGTYRVPSDENFHVYNILQKTKHYWCQVMDTNGIDVYVKFSLSYSVKKGECAFFYYKYEGYSIIDDIARAAIREQVGKYTYKEFYSKKTIEIEIELEDILKEYYLEDSHLTLNNVEVKDVILPAYIVYEDYKEDYLSIKYKVKASKNIITNIYNFDELNDFTKGDSRIPIIKSVEKQKKKIELMHEKVKAEEYLRKAKAEQDSLLQINK